MARMEIVTGRERRRRWPDEKTLQILQEVATSGLSVADVARRHDVTAKVGAGDASMRIRDLDEAIAAVSKIFVPHRIEVTGTSRDMKRGEPRLLDRT